MRHVTRTVVVLTALVLGARVARAQQSESGGAAQGDRPKDMIVTADNAAAVIENLAESWRVEGDGTSTRIMDVKVKIREEAAIASYGHVFVSYLANRQSAELVSLVVQKPDGRRVTLDSAGIKDVPPQESGAFDAPMFSDLRIKQVTVPALGVGDEVSYRVVIKDSKPDVPGQFWAEHSFAGSVVLLHESFEVNWPAGMALTIKVRPGIAQETAVPGEPGRQIRRWEHSQVSIGKAERQALRGRVRDILRGRGDPPDIQVSTFRTWDQVAAWFGALVEQAEQPSEAVRQKAADLTAGAATTAEKLARLDKFVSQDVRYVSLAFGPGRYQPRAASLVLGSSYGDCKDKESLLAALARSLGLDVRPVLISSRRLLDTEVPSPAQFDHVIARTGTGSDVVWIDGTADGARPGELVRVLRGKQALLITPDLKGVVVSTPPAWPQPQRIEIALDGSYAADGTYRLKYRRTHTGDEELAARSIFRQADDATRHEFVESLAKDDGLTGTIKVLGVTSSDVRDLATSFWYEYNVQTQYTSPLRDKAWTFWPLAPSLKLPAPDDDEPAPVDLGPLVSSHLTVRYELPPSLSIKPPVPVSVESAFGSYHSSYTAKDGVLVVDRVLATKVEMVAIADLPAYKAFRSAMDSDGSQNFAVAATTAVAPTAGTMTAEQLATAGDAAEKRGDHQTAVKYFTEATAADPKHSWAWNSLGWNLAELGRLEDALAAYNRQIDVSPYHEFAYNNRGMVFWRQKKYDAAVASFQKQIEIVPLSKFSHTNLGLLRLDRKQYPEAVESLERGVSIAPDDLRALDGLGRAYLQLHRTADALATFNHAAEVSAIPNTWNNIAWYLAENDAELDRALELAEKAVRDHTEKMSARTLEKASVEDLGRVVFLAAYWDTLGWVHFKKHNYDKAVPYLQAAWELSQRSLIAEHLGQVYEAMGRRSDAIHAYRMAVGAGKVAPELSIKRLQALSAPFDPNYSVEAVQSSLLTKRTFSVASVSRPRATAEFLLLADGTGKVVDARYIKGDEALKTSATALVGMSGSLKLPQGPALTLLRRAALTCRADGKCTVILYLPDDTRSID